jgi:hypothetical protein
LPIQFDLSAVLLHDLAAQRQSQSGPRWARRVEWLEQMGQLLRRDAGSGVGNT